MQTIRGRKTLSYPVFKDRSDPTKGVTVKKIKVVDLLSPEYLANYDPWHEADGFYFDTAAAQEFIDFSFEHCCFPEGRLAGVQFVAELWQYAVYACAYGFKRDEDGFRRYTEVFVYVPRKNGKTTAFGSVPSLYHMFVDDEKRGQNYSAAADVDQAGIVYHHAMFMVEENPLLKGLLKGGKPTPSMRRFDTIDGSFFRVLSSIADSKHGMSPSYLYIDEVHAHDNGDLIDVLVTGTGSRDQPITWYTTTADYDRPSRCNDLLSQAIQIRDKEEPGPEFLPVIYAADEEDINHWDDLDVWRKANPNFGISLTVRYIKKTIAEAKKSPENLIRLLRLHLNIKTGTKAIWIPTSDWHHGEPIVPTSEMLLPDLVAAVRSSPWTVLAQKGIQPALTESAISRYRNAVEWRLKAIERLKGEPCYGGFDGSSVNDISCFMLFFPNQLTLLPWFWVPADSIEKRSKKESIHYDIWQNAGFINHTEGGQVSEIHMADCIVGYVDQDSDGRSNGEIVQGITDHFDVRGVAFDRYRSAYIYERLCNAGIPAYEYGQSFAAMTEPMNRVEVLVGNGQLMHGDNPVLEWMIGNVCPQISNDELKRISKKLSSEKIDGPAAMLMAMGIWIYPPEEILTADTPVVQDMLENASESEWGSPFQP